MSAEFIPRSEVPVRRETSLAVDGDDAGVSLPVRRVVALRTQSFEDTPMHEEVNHDAVTHGQDARDAAAAFRRGNASYASLVFQGTSHRNDFTAGEVSRCHISTRASMTDRGPVAITHQG